MSIKVYYTSVSSSKEIKKWQQQIFDILSSKKIKHEAVDIAQDVKVKDLMRDLVGDPTALAPQIFNGDNYCGDYKAFENAIEEEALESFLKI
ncbi:SH3 domain-binding glutamic acid-rich-like protein 3 [Anarrhichthys ocellatus]|uniref:SH3 domain-binding glutamic acid-rich-like protein 3 n=1 Tax=Anarrhichthys ocellatus TaxID=433405 RepID=UPI0012EE9D08|nr:SH3 domain-binding glutamic acid-rich-like protein 3 [Anarrhichthys ocellatus]